MSLEFKYDYVNLERSETLENLVERRMDSLAKRVKSRGDKQTIIHTRFVVDARSAFGNLRDSHVVLEVKVPGIPKLLVAKKRDSDLRVAVTKAADTLVKEIQRYTEKQEHLRQH